MTVGPDMGEKLYREGAELWIERRLDEAIAKLEEAFASSCRGDQWWFATSRALAQIAMEADLLDLAEHHLRLLPDHGIGEAQQMALRGRHAMLRGDREVAADSVSIAVSCLARDDSDDIGSLMNGAIALAWGGEVLIEIGYGNEAAHLCAAARERIVRAGIDDPTVSTMLDIIEAQAARLTGDRMAAARLEHVDQRISPDFGILVARERARHAWVEGDTTEAEAKYQASLTLCARWRYPALARLIAAERLIGPPASLTDPEPIERWAERSMERLLADYRPYALVIRLLVDDDPGRYLEFEDQVQSVLRAAPHLGEVDGFGSNGEIWELFVDGDDPAALWDAIGPLVEATAPPAGSQIDIRADQGVFSVRLG